MESSGNVRVLGKMTFLLKHIFLLDEEASACVGLPSPRPSLLIHVSSGNRKLHGAYLL